MKKNMKKNKIILKLDNDTLKWFLEDLIQMRDKFGNQHFKYISYEQADDIIKQMYEYKKESKRINKNDFFKVLINKGMLKISGLDSELNPYRIINYNNKNYKILLTQVKA